MLLKTAFIGFLLLCPRLLAQSQCEAPKPQPQRYDEDYGYLSDATCRSDPMDAIKYIPLGRGEDRYLTIGGEIRQRYDYLNNPVWGVGPHDENGYTLQRYMLHTDI